MQKLERVVLFTTKKDYLLFLLFALLLFCLCISYQYYKYHQLTKFDSQLVNAVVLKQYLKTKTTKTGKHKSYKVLQLKSSDGATFYTIAKKSLPNIKNKTVELEVWAGKVSFYDYLRKYFAFSKILKIDSKPTLQQKLAHDIALQHSDENISALYKALFLAQPLPQKLQTLFSQLGISHLIAISGFHLGILTFLLYFLFKQPYKFLQKHFFPYRNEQCDLFFITAFILLAYMLTIGSPPSLLRAYAMLLIGFFLYERGVKIISMQTLFITIILLLALDIRLLFSIGFWLSAAGVFYIFLFFVSFKNLTKKQQFFFLPIWIYLCMLPYSLAIFGNFSLYHPLSILASLLFTLFYPLALLLHFLGVGDLLDLPLHSLLNAAPNAVTIKLPLTLLGAIAFLSIVTVFYKKMLYLLLSLLIFVFIKSLYYLS